MTRERVTIAFSRYTPGNKYHVCRISKQIWLKQCTRSNDCSLKLRFKRGFFFYRLQVILLLCIWKVFLALLQQHNLLCVPFGWFEADGLLTGARGRTCVIWLPSLALQTFLLRFPKVVCLCRPTSRGSPCLYKQLGCFLMDMLPPVVKLSLTTT